jgi:hypothetical protein
MIWYGGYDPSFIRQFDGFTSLTDEQIDNKIAWIPLSSEYYW